MLFWIEKWLILMLMKTTAKKKKRRSCNLGVPFGHLYRAKRGGNAKAETESESMIEREMI